MSRSNRWLPILAFVAWSACGGKHDPKPDEAPVATPAQHPGADGCVANHPRVDQTLAVIRRFDQRRSASFTLSVVVPERPVAESQEEGATSFAANPAQQDLRRRQADYVREMRKVTRELAQYLRTFEREWGKVDFDPKAKPTKLSESAVDATSAVCQVDNVDGDCKKVCLDLESLSTGRYGYVELIPSACNRRDRFEGYTWVHFCRAVFTCQASPTLINTRPGIAYRSSSFSVQLNKRYAGDQAGVDEFQRRVGAIRRCDLVEFARLTGWRFDKNWVASAKVDDGWPTILSH